MLTLTVAGSMSTLRETCGDNSADHNLSHSGQTQLEPLPRNLLLYTC
jgi:hypothetical protein